MIGNRRKTKSICAFALLVVVLTTSLFGVNASALGSYVGDSDSLYRTSLKDVENFLTGTTYAEYLGLYGEKVPLSNYGELELENLILKPETVDKDDKTPYSSGTFKSLSAEEAKKYGSDTPIVICGDDGIVTWKVTVKEDSRYNLRITYYTGDFNEGDHLISKSTAAERYVLIDGTVPYKEARSVEFEKIWADVYYVLDENGKVVVDENGKKKTYLSSSPEFLEFVRNPENHKVDSDRIFLKDFNGNELKPDKEIVAEWVTEDIYDSTGYYSEPLSFYFSGPDASKGETEKTHYISLQAVREPLAIKKIELVAADSDVTYEQYLKNNADKKDYTGSDVAKIQAEYPIHTSGNTIYSLNDRSSSFSEPQDSALIRLNEIGGDKWQYV